MRILNNKHWKKLGGFEEEQMGRVKINWFYIWISHWADYIEDRIIGNHPGFGSEEFDFKSQTGLPSIPEIPFFND